MREEGVEKHTDILLPITSKVGPSGHLLVGGCDLVELAQKYGTPLYIMDIATIKNQCHSYIQDFNFPDLESEIIFASKAFISLAMCQLVEREGLSIDVSTGGELFIALSSGFPPEKIFFHGNNKSTEEIRYGLENRIGYFVVDNFQELEVLDSLCKSYSIKQKIMLRITPGIEASTHEYIQTGKIESKFGFDLHHGFAFKAVERAISSSNLILCGLHAHIGSQIFNLECYKRLIERMFGFIQDVRKRLNLDITCLNIGGGLGIKYIPQDKPPSIKYFSQVIYGAIKENEKKYGLKLEKIYLEPGRSIVGNSGVTLYTVGNIKEIPKVKTYLSVDGGMSDNIRPMLYKAKYSAFVANRMGLEDAPKKTYCIAGKHCESGDVLIEEVLLPEVKVGDLIAIAVTGAYCYTMASNYNGQPKAGVVAVEDGKSWVWIERQRYQDLVKGNKNLYE